MFSSSGKKLWLYVSSMVITAVLELFITANYVFESQAYLDNQINKHSTTLANALSDFQLDFEIIAKEMLALSREKQLYYHYDSDANEIPESIQRKLQILRRDSGVDFNCVYTGDLQLPYPENSCTFRCTIMRGTEIYSWIDLVYSENWDAALSSESFKKMVIADKLIPINQNWCIVQIYGY